MGSSTRLSCSAHLAGKKIVGALVLLFGLTSSAYSQNTPEFRPLSVTVLDAVDDGALSGALVELMQDGQVLESQTTGSDGRVTFQVLVTGVETVPGASFSLAVPYPNPSQGQATIPLELDEAGHLGVDLFDAIGRKVASFSGVLPPGKHGIQIDLSGLSRGTYFAKVQFEGKTISAPPIVLTSRSGGTPGISVTGNAGFTPVNGSGKRTSGPNEYDIRVSKIGYDVETLSISMPAQNDVVIRLRATEINSIGMKLVRISAGSFQMGSNAGFTQEQPVHAVTLTKDFWLGQYEVTQAQYQAVTGLSPSFFTGNDRPVERVSWFDAITFANALSQAEGLTLCYDSEGNVTGGNIYSCTGYRLPTEAEWEYATRAGTTTEWSFGNDAAQAGAYAWYNSNSGSQTHPVGEKLPNPWGLYDVHGNVWEWVHDWWGFAYYSVSPSSNPPGPGSGPDRVVRGGGWISITSLLRSVFRGGSSPSYRFFNLGFRLARATN